MRIHRLRGRMPRGFPALIGLLFIAGTTASAQAETWCEPPPNLAANSSFEQGAGSLPEAWSFDSFAKTSVPVWDDTEAFTGVRSALIISQTPDDSRWIQDVSVQPDTLYFLSGWIKTEDVASPQFTDPGANISVLGGFTSTSGVLGTQDWTRSARLFRTQSENQITLAARLGFYGALATGTAWFDDVALAPLVPLEPHPRWDILVLIYRDTDFTVDVSGITHRYVASMTQDEMQQAAEAATQFAIQDIPRLTSGNMLARIEIRYPDRVLTQLSSFGDGWWPAPTDTAPERDPAFDSVIVIWDPRATDLTTGQPVWIGAAAGLTPSMGTGQTYAALVIEETISGHGRNVFKHEWGHSILFFFDAMGTAPSPTVQNHTEAGVYVHCGTGEQYVWEDETNANPIPNSIYNNDSGFTHDYYSGTVAAAEEPTRCLGITPSAWAFGGPVANSGSEGAAFTSGQRIDALIDQVDALVASGLLDERSRDGLDRALNRAAQADAEGREHAAESSLRRFARSVGKLAKKGMLAGHIAELLQGAASGATACL